MENETQVESRPAENEDVFVMDKNDFVDNEDTLDTTIVEDTTKNEAETEESTPTNTEEATKEEDYSALLKNLSSKIKYKDENIEIDSVDDVVEHYQKGKNYDTLKQKLDALAESPQIKLINKLASENGMTPEEYVKAFEKQQEENEREQEKEKIEEMILNGVPEDIAKEVVETGKLRKQLNEEKLAMQKELEEKQNKVKAEEEYDKFLEEFPDVKADDIPKEVFIKSKEIGLIPAYTKYLYEQTKKENEQLKIKGQAPVTSTTSQGGVVTEKQDDFLKGLGI